MSEARACWYWCGINKTWKGGRLLEWGLHCDEPGAMYSVGIIEKDDTHAVATVSPEWITFAACPTGSPKGQ